MKQLNTLPIEDFLDKTRIAIKSNQKTITLTIKEATDLQNSLSGEMDQLLSQSGQSSSFEVKMDGGKF